MNLGLKKRNVLITGAAKGIGRAKLPEYKIMLLIMLLVYLDTLRGNVNIKKRKECLLMPSVRHMVYNTVIILFPWLSLLFLGKQNIKRFFSASLGTVIYEIIHQKIGQRRKYWIFYDKRSSFISNELPFSIGPYMPLSMWILKFSYGNFKKFLLINVISDGFFAFPFIQFLKKQRIVSLYRLNGFQFFLYLFHKAFFLYGLQYFFEKINFTNPTPKPKQ